ncbi:MAG: N-acetylglucosamine-6-phosphate deacetylase [Clostridiales bacterium GWB2_37_7]|nr:MAG: N-acetylglucosamine-6-phosphate deacetylase [Clostridiales bacterium GWB2_37_7]
MKAIVNGKIILKDEIIENKVLLYDSKIIAIQDDLEHMQGVELIDADSCYVSPGFTDIHTHGAFGCDAMDEDVNALSTISKGLCQYGVTSFLPTTMSADKKNLQRALDNIRKAASWEPKGAKVLGAHMEGPFINPLRKGAHAEKFIIKAEYELIKDYLDIIKLITIAPEIEGNMDFINDMHRHSHISFSIGHSNATYEEALTAIESGIKSATHLFNAMAGMNHREPGVVGAVLNSDIYCELIADKIHVHPVMFKLLMKVKGSDRIILITDAMRATCMKQGVYDLGGQQVTVKQGSARLADGTLAGSVLRLDEAIRNIIENTELSLPEAIATVTINPAKLIGLYDEIGSLEAGKSADITIFDEKINIKTTIINGKQM